MTTPCSANGRSAVAPPWSTPEPRRHSPYHCECPHGFMVLYPGAGGGARIRPPRSPRTTAGVDLGSCRGCTELGSRTGVFCSDAESGLKAIIAIHSTALGPALGGT